MTALASLATQASSGPRQCEASYWSRSLVMLAARVRPPSLPPLLPPFCRQTQVQHVHVGGYGRGVVCARHIREGAQHNTSIYSLLHLHLAVGLTAVFCIWFCLMKGTLLCTTYTHTHTPLQWPPPAAPQSWGCRALRRPAPPGSGTT